MGIPESQLETWSHQGAVAQSKSTYAVVRSALDSPEAGYAGKAFEIFLQGSYCNDTNIFAESDVDVVILLDSTFHYGLEDLGEQDKAAVKATISPAVYHYDEFKADVITVLKGRFGNAVKPGEKAIHIDPEGSRRNSDVIPATTFRRYVGYSPTTGPRFDEGICFFTSGGTRIVNYPKQHSANLTARHQATNGWLKPTVRVMKNARSRLVANGVIQPSTAPSYFVEGLVYNVPIDRFGGNFVTTVANSINWILGADRTKFVCPNEQYFLLRDSSPVCWPSADCDLFLNAFWKMWDDCS
jgi:hypothetical protein